MPIDRQAPLSKAPAALLALCDIAAEDEPAFKRWYNQEHMRDRVLGLPGFRRGRRFVAERGEPKYLALYEAVDGDVFRSEAYVSLIQDPDPNSRHFVTRFQNTIRTIGRLRVSIGEAEGAILGVLPLSFPAGGGGIDDAAICHSLTGLLQDGIIIAAHILERDPSAQSVSASRHVRQGDRTFDAVVLLEASDIADIDAADRTLAAEAWASDCSPPIIFRLLYRVSPDRTG